MDIDFSGYTDKIVTGKFDHIVADLLVEGHGGLIVI